MITIAASIHCHSVADKLAVQGYLVSNRYQSIAFADGALLKISSSPLGRKAFDAVIAPGNSIGEMSGGFDLGLVDAFGPTVQRNVTHLINANHEGELNVGAAILAETGSLTIPYCAYAPTMRVPRTLEVGSDVPYLATRAALLELIKRVSWPNDVIHVLIPLMGVGTGGLKVDDVCSQIQLAVGSLQPNHGTIRNLEDGVHYDEVIRGGRVFIPR